MRSRGKGSEWYMGEGIDMAWPSVSCNKIKFWGLVSFLEKQVLHLLVTVRGKKGPALALCSIFYKPPSKFPSYLISPTAEIRARINRFY